MDPAPHPLTCRPTRCVRIGGMTIGGSSPVAVQSMAATRTRDTAATLRQIRLLEKAGADIVRVAVDSPADVTAVALMAPQVEVSLSVDLQENYRLVAEVAPHVQKVRYNPGHLHHRDRGLDIADKVAYIAEQAARFDCALRIGVNRGSVDPRQQSKFPADDHCAPMVASALEHCDLLDRLGFTRYCVSLKDSDPRIVVMANQRFATERPDVPLHLGVTEAGMPPEGIHKSRFALEKLLAQGLGDTLRVSLTVPFEAKALEVEVGRQIVADVLAGKLEASATYRPGGLNIVSCPSCSRVENSSFVELAQRVREATRDLQEQPLTIAVMGCRVNGPGETDSADLGLWCAPDFVNLKRGSRLVGRFSYDEVLDRLRDELEDLIRPR